MDIVDAIKVEISGTGVITPKCDEKVAEVDTTIQSVGESIHQEL
jgi:hypothetical protein